MSNPPYSTSTVELHDPSSQPKIKIVLPALAPDLEMCRSKASTLQRKILRNSKMIIAAVEEIEKSDNPDRPLSAAVLMDFAILHKNYGIALSLPASSWFEECTLEDLQENVMLASDAIFARAQATSGVGRVNHQPLAGWLADIVNDKN